MFVVEGNDVESVTCSISDMHAQIKAAHKEYRKECGQLTDEDEVDVVDGKVHSSGLEV